MDWTEFLGLQAMTFLVAVATSVGASILTSRFDRGLYGAKPRLAFDRASCEFWSDIAVGISIDSNMIANQVYFRLQVTNVGHRTLRGCRAWLVRVERLNGNDFFQPTNYRDTLPLVWSYDDSIESVDLPPGVQRYFDVALAVRDHEGLLPRLLGMNVPNRYESAFVGFDAWRLGVLVSGEDTQPVQGDLIIRHFESELAVERFDLK